MDSAGIIARLEATGAALVALYAGLPEQALRTRPAPDRWSPLEVLCHLVDEEREDFRQRVFSTLENPSRPWPSIDPAGWARDRGYADRDPAAALAWFAEERAASLAALRLLDDPDWDLEYAHPLLGPLRAGDLLAAWATHDVLHLRQLAEALSATVAAAAAPYHVRYAKPRESVMPRPGPPPAS